MKCGTLLAIYYELCVTHIEKETLSIAFGVDCFHEFLYGFRFITIKYHKP